MKDIITKHWPLGIIFLTSVLIVWPLFLPGYFSHHDDLQVMRIFEMRKCLEDLQFPCRWVPDMGYGNGYPLFNYYNPFPYYIGSILSFLFGFIVAAKILFLIPLILGGISMFVLIKDIFNKQAGILAAILYMFAPYRALDSYVRGAVAESFAIAIFPLILYFVLKVIRQGSGKYLILLSITIAAFLTSHTIMTLLFLPVLIIIIFYWLLSEKITTIKTVMIGIILGFGLAAFFIIPAYFEKNLVQIDNLSREDLDFRAHFVTIKQLFTDRSWGYGASFSGPEDTISFQIGLPHWVIVFFTIPVVLVLKRKDRKVLFFSIVMFLFFLFSIFMAHNKSAFVWEKIGLLRFTQFPWRFLALTIFTASVLGGCLIFCLKQKILKIVLVILIIITVVLNWNYFRPNKFLFDINDQEKLSGSSWETQQKASILDYLPVGAVAPIEPAPIKPIIKSGQAKVASFEKKSNSFKLSLDIISAAMVEIPIMDFPNWKVYENNTLLQHTNDNYVNRITLSLQEGNHTIIGKFTNTTIRTVSNLISLISLLIILYWAFYAKNRKFVK